MPRSQSQTSRSVSLFPFLAVLVCAMGALILLLIVTTRRIRRETLHRIAEKTDASAIPVSAPTTADAEPHDDSSSPVPTEPKTPSVQPTVPALHRVVTSPDATTDIMAAYTRRIERTNRNRNATLNQLQSRREQLAAHIKERQNRLNAAQRQAQAIKAKLQQLTATQTQLRSDLKSKREQTQLLQGQLKGITDGITRLRQDIDRLNAERAQASSRFSIIPFDGSTGTTRRPIFIECTKKELRFLPEGVTVTAEDLEGFSAAGNPLLAGTNALVHYWAAKSRVQGEHDEPEPYVLLLVRPSGSVAYYAARKMLRGYDGPSGYELIGEDWDLKLPPVDSRARAVCRHAVDRALAKRNRQADAGRRSPRDSRRGFGHSTSSRQMRFNRATGRFEEIKPRSVAGQVAGRPRRGSNTGPLDSGFGRIVTDDSNSEHADSRRARSRRRKTVSLGPQPADAKTKRQAGHAQRQQNDSRKQANISRKQTNASGRNTTDDEGTSRRKQQQKQRDTQRLARRSADSADDTSKNDARSAVKAKAAATAPPLWPLNGRNDGLRSGDSALPPGSRFASKTPAAASRGSAIDGPQSRGQKPPQNDSQNDSRRFQPPHRINKTGTDRRNGNRKVAGYPSGTTYKDDNAGNNRSANRFRNRRSQEASSQNGSFQPSSQHKSSQHRSSRHGNSQHGRNDGNNGSSNAPAVNGRRSVAAVLKGMSDNGDGSQTGNSGNGSGRAAGASRKQDIRWGLSPPAASIGFEKDVMIWCSADRVVVGGRKTIPVDKHVTGEVLFRRVVLALDAEARSWGRPPKGFYWIPAVRFVISPGGNQHYERLRRPLEQLGLNTAAEHRLDTSPPSTQLGEAHGATPQQ